MDFSKFFIDRPIFAAVLSIVIFAAGLIAIPLLPISEYPDVVPPIGGGAHGVSRRQPEGDRRDRGHAARGGDQRRRGHDVPQVGRRLRRRPADDRHLPPRHRCRRRGGARAEPRRPGAGAAARGRAPAGRDHAEAVARSSSWWCTWCRRTASTTRCTCATTCACTSRTSWRACPASARRRSSAAATTRCASGWIRTRSLRAASPPVTWCARCASRTSRSRPASSAPSRCRTAATS